MVAEKQGGIGRKTLIVNNNIEESDLLFPYMQEIEVALHLPESLTNMLNLALEEALVNSISYAYPKGETGKVSLTTEWKEPTSTLVFTLVDRGIPFDPTAMPEVDTTLSADERPIGGLGIYLIRKIMTDVRYERVNDENHLIMQKRIER